MDNLISFYKDPLFSIIIIISIIILVAIADYTRNRFKLKEKKDTLKALADNFNYYEFDKHISQALEISNAPMQTLTFIANVYIANGNFDEAVKIYLTMLDKSKDLKSKMEIFELLGIAYYKAGFMQKAKNIFIEILKNNPRNTKVLSLLMQTYEVLGEYKNAYDVISCIEELEGDKKELKNYISMLILINDNLLSISQREKNILEINSLITTKLALQYFYQYNIKLFWELLFRCENIANYIDLLWNIKNPPLEFIKDSKQIADVYRAKGLIDDDVACDIFELETLRILNKYSSKNAHLGFKYRCNICQSTYPFDNTRCPTCSEIGSISLVLEILENKNEKNYSLL